MAGQELKFAGGFKGNRLLEIQERLFWDYSTISLEFVLLGIGLFVSARRVYTAFVAAKTDPAAIPLFYFLINYLFILLLLDIDWGRYLLPTVIATKIIVAIGISTTISWFSIVRRAG